jgi:glucosyl-dolichyl phosphate glucuronosyltransferase
MSQISVIICAYTLDRWDDLVQALDSVQAQTEPPLETILVIDRSEELLARAREEITGVTLLANAHRGGLSGSRQTGADVARGQILAFLDDDAVADPEWLAELARPYEDPDVLGVGGLIEPRWVDPAPSWFPGEFNWVVGCSYDGLPTQTSRVRNTIGANMSMRAEVMRNTGDWETSLGRAYEGDSLGSTAEETEFCIRATRLHDGGYWLYVPSAKVGHRVGPERGTWSYFVRRCRVEGKAKALIAELEGSATGLQSERAYTFSVLPRAIIRDLGAGLTGDVHRVARAGAIVAGLAITAFEYLRTKLARRRALAGAELSAPPAAAS